MKYFSNSLCHYLLDSFYPLQIRKKIRVLRQIVCIACSVIGFMFCPISFIEYLLDVQIWHWYAPACDIEQFLEQFILTSDISTRFYVVSATHTKCLSGSTIS